MSDFGYFDDDYDNPYDELAGVAFPGSPSTWSDPNQAIPDPYLSWLEKMPSNSAEGAVNPTPLARVVPQSASGGAGPAIAPRLAATQAPAGVTGENRFVPVAVPPNPANGDQSIASVTSSMSAPFASQRQGDSRLAAASQLSTFAAPNAGSGNAQSGMINIVPTSSVTTNVGRLGLQDVTNMLATGNAENRGVTPQLANALSALRSSLAANNLDANTVDTVLDMDLSGVDPVLRAKLYALKKYVMQFGPGATGVQVNVHAIPTYDQTGDGAWRAGNDEAFLEAVNQFNLLHGFRPGDAEYATVDGLKAQAMVESGGTRAAFETDPLQVNVPADWPNTGSDKLKYTALTGADEAMTPFLSAYAALQLMHRKRFNYDRMGNITSTKSDWQTLRDYNGNPANDRPGAVDHRSWYADTVTALARRTAQANQ